MNNREAIIKIRDLNVTYFKGKPNEIQPLKNVNLDIYPGEFIIFFGPSGCGKSTLLYAISGLETAIDGEIVINGKDISKLKEKELEKFHQQSIGMVFQAYYLINSLSVIKNIILPQLVNKSISNKNRKIKAIKLLEQFGISNEIKRYPSELSGGQQQRVAVARALINEPDILLADEPVGNLDSKSAKDVMNMFGKLNEEQKKTIILVTHNPAHLDIAHRVFFIKDGEVVDIKRNREQGESYLSEADSPPSQQVKEEASQELKILQNSFAGLISCHSREDFDNFKAREIILEVFAGLSSNDLSSMSSYIERLFASGLNDKDEMLSYLDDGIKNGGLGLDKRTAYNLTKKIKNIVSKIKDIQDVNNQSDAKELKSVVNRIHSYLISEFKIKFKGISEKNNFYLILQDRFLNKIDGDQFQIMINSSVDEGGANIHISHAKRVSDRIELLLLGKYNNAKL